MNDIELLGKSILKMAEDKWENLTLANSHKWHPSYVGKFKNKNGIVQLRGCIENTSATKKDVVVAYIPKPEVNAPTILTTTIVPLMTADANQLAKIEIGTNGAIKVLNVTSGKNIYLNTIIYMR